MINSETVMTFNDLSKEAKALWISYVEALGGVNVARHDLILCNILEDFAKVKNKDNTAIKEMISSMIKGQIAFGGGFNSEKDVEKTVNSIVFGLKLGD